jgi:hypothetical protein
VMFFYVCIALFWVLLNHLIWGNIMLFPDL